MGSVGDSYYNVLAESFFVLECELIDRESLGGRTEQGNSKLGPAVTGDKTRGRITGWMST